MLVTDDGMSTLVRLLQPRNANCAHHTNASLAGAWYGRSGACRGSGDSLTAPIYVTDDGMSTLLRLEQE